MKTLIDRMKTWNRDNFNNGNITEAALSTFNKLFNDGTIDWWYNTRRDVIAPMPKNMHPEQGSYPGEWILVTRTNKGGW